MTTATQYLQKTKSAQMRVGLVSHQYLLDYPVMDTGIHTHKFPYVF